MKKNIFVSPHLDDVVLSCAEIIVKEVSCGNSALILNVFTKEYNDDSISENAKNFHDLCGYSNKPITNRKIEDQRALKTLGVESLYLDEYEALYRKNINNEFHYYQPQSHFNSELSNELSYINRLTARIESILNYLEFDYIYIPLGIGNHIDHLIIRYVFEKIVANKKIIYYEDIPYKLEYGNLMPSSYTFELESEIIEVDSELFRKKIEALKYYTSQIPILWENKEDMMEQLSRAYIFVNSVAYIRVWRKFN